MRNGILREGSIAGFLGATSVAAWFFIIDVALRHPFHPHPAGTKRPDAQSSVRPFLSDCLTV